MFLGMLRSLQSEATPLGQSGPHRLMGESVLPSAPHVFCPPSPGQHHTRLCKEEPENPDWSWLLLLESPVYSQLQVAGCVLLLASLFIWSQWNGEI